MFKLAAVILVVSIASETMAQTNRVIVCRNQYTEKSLICPERKDVTIRDVQGVHIAADLPQQCSVPTVSYETLLYSPLSAGIVQQACKYRFRLGRSECILDGNALSPLFQQTAVLQNPLYDRTPIRAQIDYDCTGNLWAFYCFILFV